MSTGCKRCGDQLCLTHDLCRACVDEIRRHHGLQSEPDTVTLPASVVREVAEALTKLSACHFDGRKRGMVCCGYGCDMGDSGRPTDERGHDFDCIFRHATDALALLERHLPKEGK